MHSYAYVNKTEELLKKYLFFNITMNKGVFLFTKAYYKTT